VFHGNAPVLTGRIELIEVIDYESKPPNGSVGDEHRQHRILDVGENWNGTLKSRAQTISYQKEAEMSSLPKFNVE